MVQPSSVWYSPPQPLAGTAPGSKATIAARTAIPTLGLCRFVTFLLVLRVRLEVVVGELICHFFGAINLGLLITWLLTSLPQLELADVDIAEYSS